jgi:hypothetical protein
MDMQGVSLSTTCGLDMQWVSLSPPPTPEPVFLNVYGAQESIPRDQFRPAM